MRKNNYFAETDGGRIDSFIATSSGGDISRTHAKNLITDGMVTVNGLSVKASYLVKAGDDVEVKLIDTMRIDLTPEDIHLDIVYEDDYIAVINKQQGLTVHPSETQHAHTLVNAILYHIKNLSGINGEIRPGIVHRLDKNTSGLIVIAKCDMAHKKLALQLEDKTCRRDYIALLMGNLKEDSGIVDKPIARSRVDRKKMAIDMNGRRAITEYRVVKRYERYTLTEFSLKTGRTHQIRVHAKYLGHPVVGDTVYGSQNQPFKLNGQLLHAYKLSFIHPKTNERVEYEAPLPDYFEKVLASLK